MIFVNIYHDRRDLVPFWYQDMPPLYDVTNVILFDGFFPDATPFVLNCSNDVRFGFLTRNRSFSRHIWFDVIWSSSLAR